LYPSQIDKPLDLHNSLMEKRRIRKTKGSGSKWQKSGISVADSEMIKEMILKSEFRSFLTHFSVFLNGQGMECQHIHFQKKQLAKGMNYILELAARRYNVNPMKLCDMDGRRITEPSQLMSRGAYVLVAAGQSFRDTWYFLPDNAIDTSSNRQRVEDRVDQRDRLLQRRERREQAKLWVPTMISQWAKT
uniref:Doublecortin domain-containing protein n=1 Tax=Heligmosomoides polygyrus TaxID=6339 RepID=A0A183FSX6_HELPZ